MKGVFPNTLKSGVGIRLGVIDNPWVAATVAKPMQEGRKKTARPKKKRGATGNNIKEMRTRLRLRR